MIIVGMIVKVYLAMFMEEKTYFPLDGGNRFSMAYFYIGQLEEEARNSVFLELGFYSLLL